MALNLRPSSRNMNEMETAPIPNSRQHEQLPLDNMTLPFSSFSLYGS
jgi:hypothetical protein